jgi:hypothetical protein
VPLLAGLAGLALGLAGLALGWVVVPLELPLLGLLELLGLVLREPLLPVPELELLGLVLREPLLLEPPLLRELLLAWAIVSWPKSIGRDIPEFNQQKATNAETATLENLPIKSTGILLKFMYPS